MNAAIYLNCSGSEARQRLEEYKDLAVKYCEEKGYDLLVLMQFVGPAAITEGMGQSKILELARKHLVDMIIIPDLHTLSSFLPDALCVLREIYQYGVRVECLEEDEVKCTVCQARHKKIRPAGEKNSRDIFVVPVFLEGFMSEVK